MTGCKKEPRQQPGLFFMTQRRRDAGWETEGVSLRST